MGVKGGRMVGGMVRKIMGEGIRRVGISKVNCESYGGKSVSIQQCGTVFQVLFIERPM